MLGLVTNALSIGRGWAVLIRPMMFAVASPSGQRAAYAKQLACSHGGGGGGQGGRLVPSLQTLSSRQWSTFAGNRSCSGCFLLQEHTWVVSLTGRFIGNRRKCAVKERILCCQCSPSPRTSSPEVPHRTPSLHVLSS